MNERLLRVANRIRDELEELTRVLDRAQEGMRRAQQTSDDFYWDSVALNLHGLYAGLERLFEIIAATIDGNVPERQLASGVVGTDGYGGSASTPGRDL